MHKTNHYVVYVSTLTSLQEHKTFTHTFYKGLYGTVRAGTAHLTKSRPRLSNIKWKFVGPVPENQISNFSIRLIQIEPSPNEQYLQIIFYVVETLFEVIQMIFDVAEHLETVELRLCKLHDHDFD